MNISETGSLLSSSKSYQIWWVSSNGLMFGVIFQLTHQMKF